MTETAPAARGYSDEQAAKISAAYARLIDAGESVTVHKLRAEAKTGLAAVQAWLAANVDAPGIDVPAIPAEDLADILAPLWARAWSLATEATEAAAAEATNALQADLATVTERAERAEAQLTELTTGMAELTARLAQAAQALSQAEDLQAALAAAQARTEAAEDRAERAEARADEQMRLLGDLIRGKSEG